MNPVMDEQIPYTNEELIGAFSTLRRHKLEMIPDPRSKNYILTDYTTGLVVHGSDEDEAINRLAYAYIEYQRNQAKVS